MKKFLAAILTVAFVVGIISTFAKVNVAEAMQHNIWKCVKCGKKVQSTNNPGQYPCYAMKKAVITSGFILATTIEKFITSRNAFNKYFFEGIFYSDTVLIEN